MLVGGVYMLLCAHVPVMRCCVKCSAHAYSSFGSSEGFPVAAIGPMAPQPSLVFVVIELISTMAPVLRAASIDEAKPYALDA